MKAVRILVKTVVVIVIVLIAALLTLPLWFGPVVKTAANAAVPGIVKTDFRLGHIHLNPYTARFELGDLKLWNPKGYSEEYAVTLGDIIFDADTFSLMTDVIHIEEITVKDVFVSVVSGGENKVDNFRQIQYNVAGGKEKYEAAQAAKEDEANLSALKEKETAQQKREPEPESVGSETKVIIDKLHISGLKVQYGFLPISVPVTIELADIGRKSGGATLEETWQAIWQGILKAAGVAGEQLGALGNLTGEAAKQAGAVLGSAAEGATKVAGQATEAVGSAAGAAVDTAADATKAVGGAVSDAAAGATKAAGKAVDAAAEGATKALDTLKNLW